MYDRSRLFQDVDVNSPPAITLIIAESGYGKTVVAKQYVESLNIPYIWNTLDQWSSYEHTLYDQTKLLLTEKYPSIDVTMLTDNDPIQLARHLKTYGAPIVYVIDNCHYLNISDGAISWLNQFIHAAQGFCYFVLVGQEQPRLEMIDALSTMDTLVLGKIQLRLTNNDTDNLAEQFEVSTDFVHNLISSNDGLFAGIRPWLDNYGQLSPRHGKPQIREFNLDIYIDTILSGISAKTLQLLYKSTIPEKFSQQQLIDIFTDDHMDKEWGAIGAAQLFLTKLSGSDYYQYHELTRRIILDKLIQADGNQYQKLNYQYANWYENEEVFDTAIYHYLEAQSSDNAIRLMNYVVDMYRLHGFSDSLLNLENLFRQHNICVPALHLACVKILMTDLKLDQALESIDYVYRSFSQNIPSLLNTKLQTRKAYIAIRKGQFDSGIATLETIQHDIVLDDADSILTFALIQMILGQALFEITRYDQAEVCLLKAKGLYLEMNNQADVANVLQDLARLYTQSGQLDKAGEPLLHMLKIREQLKDPSGLANACNNIGSYYIQRHDYENGEKYFKQGLEHCETANDQRIQSYLFWNLGDLYRDIQNPEVALSYYDKALQLVSHSDLSVQCGVLASLARLYTFHNQQENVINNLKMLNLQAQELNSNLYLRIAELGLLLLTPSINLEQILESFHDIHISGHQVELMRAMGPVLEYALSNNIQFMVDTLKDILVDQIQSQQSTQPFIAHLTYSSVLWQYVEDQPILDNMIELASQLKTLQDKSLAQQLQSEDSMMLNTNIHFNTFNAESITIDDKQLSYSELPGQLQRELIYWLYFTGSKRHNQIILQFWKNFSSKKANAAFRSMKYRINQKLGEFIVLQDGMYQISNAYTVTSDALQYESVVQKAKMGSFSDVRTDDLWLKALKLYQEDFLSEFDRDWVIYLRDKYHQYLIDALIGLSHCALSRKDESAIAYAQWAIRENDFDESSYRHLMTVFAKYGRINDMVDTYQSLTNHLMTELGVTVSRETSRLYQNLMQNR